MRKLGEIHYGKLELDEDGKCRIFKNNTTKNVWSEVMKLMSQKTR